MLLETLQSLFSRDLAKLRKEIASYKSERAIWTIDKGIANSGGNLCLHLVGNLNAYIGAVLGDTGYVRNRDAEFALKDISQAQLLKMMDETIAVVEKTFPKISLSQLSEEYPEPVFDFSMTTEYFLVHLAMHLGYHLGQINYHRRLLDV